MNMNLEFINMNSHTWFYEISNHDHSQINPSCKCEFVWDSGATQWPTWRSLLFGLKFGLRLTACIEHQVPTCNLGAAAVKLSSAQVAKSSKDRPGQSAISCYREQQLPTVVTAPYSASTSLKRPLCCIQSQPLTVSSGFAIADTTVPGSFDPKERVMSVCDFSQQ